MYFDKNLLILTLGEDRRSFTTVVVVCSGSKITRHRSATSFESLLYLRLIAFDACLTDEAVTVME